MSKVLVLEDNMTKGEDLYHVLEDAGHEVRWVSRLADVPLDEEYEWYILDLNLPDGDSIAVTKVIHEKYPAAKLIAASGEKDGRERQKKAGCQFEMSPFDDVLGIIKN